MLVALICHQLEIWFHKITFIPHKLFTFMLHVTFTSTYFLGELSYCKIIVLLYMEALILVAIMQMIPDEECHLECM